MITIAVANTKGGVGRTTLSAALAVRAAQDSDHVAMVDLDPQRSLVEWWKRRRSKTGKSGNPTIFEGVDDPADAVERALTTATEWLFLDGPPAFLTVVKAMIEVADFTLIPIKPSVGDLLASEDAVVLARGAGAAHLVVLNDVGAQERDRVVRLTREELFNHDIPIARQEIIHRVAHITGMNTGKVAGEVKGGTAAAEEIENLWTEVKAAAMKAARTRRARKAAAND
jgi:chromosome partitioning protein